MLLGSHDSGVPRTQYEDLSIEFLLHAAFSFAYHIRVDSLHLSGTLLLPAGKEYAHLTTIGEQILNYCRTEDEVFFVVYY